MYSFTATSATCFRVTWEHPFVPGVRCWKSCAYFPGDAGTGFCALLLALLIGIPLGILSAVWRNRWLDHLVRIMAITGISTPAFWLGLGVIVLFYGHLQILPGGGRLDDWLDPPTHVTGFYLLDALLEGNGEVFFNALQHLILPALTLAFVHRELSLARSAQLCWNN